MKVNNADLNGLANEIYGLENVGRVDVIDNGVLVTCTNRKTIRFLRYVAKCVREEFDELASPNIKKIDSDDYWITFSCSEGIDVSKVILNMAAWVDAIACDMPKMYK